MVKRAIKAALITETPPAIIVSMFMLIIFLGFKE